MPILEAASEHSQYDSSMNKQLPKFLHPRSDEKAGKELRCEDGGFISNGTVCCSSKHIGFWAGANPDDLVCNFKNCNKVVVMEEKKLAEHELKKIVIVSTIATSEVHPVELQPDGDHKDEHGDDDHHVGQEKSMEGLDGFKPNEESPV